MMYGHCQQAEEGEPSFQLSTCKPTFGVMGPGLASPEQERHGYTSASPAKGSKMIKVLETA